MGWTLDYVRHKVRSPEQVWIFVLARFVFECHLATRPWNRQPWIRQSLQHQSTARPLCRQKSPRTVIYMVTTKRSQIHNKKWWTNLQETTAPLREGNLRDGSTTSPQKRRRSTCRIILVASSSMRRRDKDVNGAIQTHCRGSIGMDRSAPCICVHDESIANSPFIILISGAICSSTFSTSHLPTMLATF
jgi:hypothetical protein